MTTIKEFGSDAARRWYFANLSDSTDSQGRGVFGSKKSSIVRAVAVKSNIQDAKKDLENAKTPSERSKVLHNLADLHKDYSRHVGNISDHSAPIYSSSIDKEQGQLRDKAIAYKTRALNLDKAIARKSGK